MCMPNLLHCFGFVCNVRFATAATDHERSTSRGSMLACQFSYKGISQSWIPPRSLYFCTSFLLPRSFAIPQE
eukprot:3479149-Amphidinium_carterae.1